MGLRFFYKFFLSPYIQLLYSCYSIWFQDIVSVLLGIHTSRCRFLGIFPGKKLAKGNYTKIRFFRTIFILGDPCTYLTCTILYLVSPTYYPCRWRNYMNGHTVWHLVWKFSGFMGLIIRFHNNFTTSIVLVKHHLVPCKYCKY